MILTVKRRLIAIDNRNNQWQDVDYKVVVWEFDTNTDTVTVHPGKDISVEGYYPGLLECVVDGMAVDLHRFDQELSRHCPHWTRQEIVRAIQR